VEDGWNEWLDDMVAEFRTVVKEECARLQLNACRGGGGGGENGWSWGSADADADGGVGDATQFIESPQRAHPRAHPALARARLREKRGGGFGFGWFNSALDAVKKAGARVKQYFVNKFGGGNGGNAAQLM